MKIVVRPSRAKCEFKSKSKSKSDSRSKSKSPQQAQLTQQLPRLTDPSLVTCYTKSDFVFTHFKNEK